MTEQIPEGLYWSIDLPGLTQAQAEALLGMAEKQGMSFGGSLVDPSQFLTFHLDRSTVESLHKALSSITDAAEARYINGLREEMKEWLDLFPPPDEK